MKTISYLLALIVGLILMTPAYAQTVPLSIDSDPQGATFSLEVPNERFSITGVTPARVNNVPTGKAIVNFQTLEGCTGPQPQSRVLDSNEPIQFFGRYACGNTEEEPTITVQPPIVPAKNVSLRLSPHQLEFLPGGKVEFTVAAHNDGQAIAEPIVIIVEFNEAELTLDGTLVKGGSYLGNGRVQWTLPSFSVNETWSTNIPLRVATTVTTDKVGIHASIHGAGISSANASAMIGTPGLPKTGFSFDTMFLLLSAVVSAGFIWKRRLA